jgi:hypothetical protein
MFFGKKNKDSEEKCSNCDSNVDKEFSFCPYCGESLVDAEEEKEKYGLLGKSDYTKPEVHTQFGGFGITDKLVNSLMSNIMKAFESQMKEMDSSVENLPNGIRIKLGAPKKAKKKQPVKREVTEEQIKKMSTLPRDIAKTNVRRLGDKVIYEISARGVTSPNDIFISKLESGYEFKAIGGKKVYVNSLPVDLPLNKLQILKNKILVEFNAAEDTQ